MFILILLTFSFLVNTPATVFMILDFNQVLPVLFGFSSTVVATITASRAVRRLSEYQAPGVPETFSTGTGPLRVAVPPLNSLNSAGAIRLHRDGEVMSGDHHHLDSRKLESFIVLDQNYSDSMDH